MKLYGLKNCDSCKKALKALQAAGKNVEFIDLRENPVTTDQLENWLDQHGDDVVVNRKSTTWRGLDDAARQHPALALLQAHPTLIKRPVIVTDSASFIGWTADVRAALGLD